MLNLSALTPAVRRQYNALAGSPERDITRALLELNALVGGYGVEYAPSVNDSPSGQSVYGLEYVNSGDAYRPTVGYNHQTGRFFWGKSYGDIVERMRDGFYK